MHKAQFYTDFYCDTLCIYISEDSTNAKRVTSYHDNEKFVLSNDWRSNGRKRMDYR